MGFSPSMFLRQVSILHRHSPYSFVSSLIAAILIATIFWSIKPSELLVNWLTACCFLFAIRYFIYWKFQQNGLSVTNASMWFALFIGASFFSGILWGSLGIIYHSELVLSFQEAMMINSITVIFLVALVSGAIIIHAMNMVIMLSFTIPAVLPYAFYLLNLDIQFFNLLGVLLLLFFAFLYALQVRFDRRIHELFWRDELNAISAIEKEEIQLKTNH